MAMPGCIACSGRNDGLDDMKLRTFGGLAIINGADATADPILQRRQLALLAVLSAEGPAGVTRDRLLFLFWPDKTADKARHALDQVLYVTRRELGAEALLQGPTTLRLNATILPSDVAEFAAAIARNDLEAAVSCIQRPVPRRRPYPRCTGIRAMG